MKKAELLKLRKLTVTQKMKNMVKEDKGEERPSYGYNGRKRILVYRYYKYYRAAEENGFLKVAIFARKDIEDGIEEPECTIFFDKEKKEWISYSESKGSWSKAMVFNLNLSIEDGECYSSYTYCNTADTKKIRQYLGTKGEAKTAIREYQAEIRRVERDRRYKNEMDKIDEFIQTVPEEPKDFEKWLKRSAYKNDSYIIMRPGKVEKGYCTHCKKMVAIGAEKPRHGTNGKCPRCKAEVTYKAFGKQRELKDWKKIGIVQRTNTGEFTLRLFWTSRKLKKETEYKVEEWSIEQKYIFRMNKYFYTRDVYEYTFFKNTTIKRWCEAVYSHWGGGVTSFCVLYEKNINDIIKDSKAKYVPLKEILRHNMGKELYVEDTLFFVRTRPAIEKIFKANLFKLTSELIRREGDGEIIWNANKLQDMLKLDKQHLNQAIEMNIDRKELRILQAMCREKKTYSNEVVEGLKSFFCCSRIDDIVFLLREGKVEKMIHYLKKVSKETGIDEMNTGRDYRDYLEQLRKLGIPANKTTRFPSNFQATHARLAEQIEEIEEQKKQKETAEKERKLKKVIDKAKKLYFGKSEQYIIIWPKTKKDFQREGQEQHNCVASYFGRMAAGETIVFFLRKKEDIKKPFCTVEFKQGKMVQCRIACNRDAPKEVLDFMKVIERNYKKTVEGKRNGSVRNKAVCAV